MATFEERESARSELFEVLNYDKENGDSSVLRKVVNGRFEWESIEELVADAENNSQLGYENLDSPFEGMGNEIESRIKGHGDEVIHERIRALHRINVNGKLGKWYNSRETAWNGDLCTVLDGSGEAMIVRAFELSEAKIEYLESGTTH